jgi:pyruvate/2-oxoglutarate dehydrogenase complex dihydrolipoamide acyltransferase (E2) component
MSVKLVVPSLGTEVTEGIVGEWLKAVGEMVKEGEPVVVVGTPKLNLEVEAPVTGVLSEMNAGIDDVVEVGATLGIIDEGGAGA